MTCKNCGASCADNDNFCISCGASLTESNQQDDSQQQTQAKTVPQQQVPSNPQSNAQQFEQQTFYRQPQYQYTPPMYQPPFQQPVVDTGVGFAAASMVFGILSIFCMPPIISSILAIVFGAVARSKGSKNGMSTAGIICGIVGLVVFLVYFITVINTGSQIYYSGTFV